MLTSKYDSLINDWKEDYKLLSNKLVNKKLYHYTSLKVLWLILENNIMWARNVRFSNDKEEYTMGKRLIKKIDKEGVLNDSFDSYMICFCEKDNLLSQWREYARNGVEITMDFEQNSVFSVMNNDKTIKANDKKYNSDIEKNYRSGLRYYDEYNGYLKKYAAPAKVYYTNEKSRIRKLINIKDDINDNLDKYKRLQIAKVIPFIKHNGFKEEHEARVIFDILDLYRYNKICYQSINDIKIPYIKVKYGDAEKQIQDVNEIFIGREIDSNIVDIIKEELEDEYSRIFSVERVKGKDIFIGEGKDEEDIFTKVEELGKRFIGSTKIWCKGYWPIREIKVGPFADQDRIKESIEHYCKSNFWLKYVTVLASDTPYRSK